MIRGNTLLSFYEKVTSCSLLTTMGSDNDPKKSNKLSLSPIALDGSTLSHKLQLHSTKMASRNSLCPLGQKRGALYRFKKKKNVFVRGGPYFLTCSHSHFILTKCSLMLVQTRQNTTISPCLEDQTAVAGTGCTCVKCG